VTELGACRADCHADRSVARQGLARAICGAPLYAKRTRAPCHSSARPAALPAQRPMRAAQPMMVCQQIAHVHIVVAVPHAGPDRRAHRLFLHPQRHDRGADRGRGLVSRSRCSRHTPPRLPTLPFAGQQCLNDFRTSTWFAPLFFLFLLSAAAAPRADHPYCASATCAAWSTPASGVSAGWIVVVRSCGARAPHARVSAALLAARCEKNAGGRSAAWDLDGFTGLLLA